MKGKPNRKLFRHRLNEMVASLRNDILNGNYQPGDFLPSETALVKQYRMSNKSVRKGLDQLVKEGYIVKIHRVGSKVTDVGQRAACILTLFGSADIFRELQLPALVEAFSRRYPSIRVRTITVPVSADDASERYYAAVRELCDNGLVDIFLLNQNVFREFVEAGRLSELEPTDWDRNHHAFLHGLFSEAGGHYAKPLAYSPVVLCYNKEHFAEAGLPEPDGSWTWMQLLRQASVLSEKRLRCGFSADVLSELFWPLIFVQGMAADGKEGSVDFDRLPQVLQLYQQLARHVSVFPFLWTGDGEEAPLLFVQGSVSMVLTTYAGMHAFGAAPFPFGVAPVPQLAAPVSQLTAPVTLLTAVGAAVSAKSKRKPEANLFVQFLASPEGQQMVRDRTYALPALKAVAESDEPRFTDGIDGYGRYREMTAAFRDYRALPLAKRFYPKVRGLLRLFGSELIDERSLSAEIRGLFRESGVAPLSRPHR